MTLAFQLALAAGAPWGHLTWAGRFPGRLPNTMRGVALASAILLGLMALIVAARAGIAAPQWSSASATLIWMVVGYCALGVVANAVTPSRSERRLWLPVAGVMLVSSLVVALG